MPEQSEPTNNRMSRRDFLHSAMTIAGGVAAAHLLGPDSARAAAEAPADALTHVPSASPDTPTLSLWYDTWGPEELWTTLWKETEETVGVKLDVSIVPFDDHETKVLTSLAAGLGPDIQYTHPMYTGTFANQGITLPLNPFIEAEKYDLSKFFPDAIKCQSWGEEILGLPIEYPVNVYFYNKDLIAQAGLEDPVDLWKAGKWDCATLIDYATKLTKGEGDDSQFGLGEPHKTLRLQNPFIMGFGGQVWTDDFSKVVLNSPEALQAWDFIADHVRKGWSAKVAGRDSASNVTLTGLFNSGKLAIFSTHRGFLSSLNPDLNVGMVEYPVWPVGKSITRSIGDGFGGLKRTQYPEKVWQAVKYICERGMVMLVEAQSGAPTMPSYMESEDWTKSLLPWEINDVWLAAGSHAVADHLPPGFGEQDKIAQAYYDEVALGLKSAQEAMDAAAAEMQVVLDEKMDRS
jgi:multiple sugar transport system substrate-binding protein